MNAYSHRTSGMTLVELNISIVVLAIAFIGLTDAYLLSIKLAAFSNDRVIAENALRSQTERMLSLRNATFVDPYEGMQYTDIDSIIRRHTTIDPDTGLRQDTFDVLDLASVSTVTMEEKTRSVASAASVPVGRIIFYLDESLVPIELGGDESSSVEIDGFLFGPRDLNNNHFIGEDLSIANDGRYPIQMLPVEFRAMWQSRVGVVTERSFLMLPRRMIF